MKQRPILFSTEMVKAIFDFRKTQTRRILKNIPRLSDTIDWTCEHLSKNEDSRHFYCPYGQPGDVLWVRESFQIIGNQIFYKADPTSDYKNIKWRPSIHMPKAEARLWLEITDVRVERVQDITNSDAHNEGVDFVKSSIGNCYRDYRFKSSYNSMTSAFQSFKTLWKKINGENSWEENPWVWVIEFKRIQKP